MKYCQEMTDEISKYLEEGMNRVDACILAGVSYQTFLNWMEKFEFLESIKRAETKFKNKNIAIIQKAAVKSWQAAAWLMERKYSDEFALKQKFEHSGQVVHVNIEKEKEELRAMIKDIYSKNRMIAEPVVTNGN